MEDHRSELLRPPVETLRINLKRTQLQIERELTILLEQTRKKPWDQDSVAHAAQQVASMRKNLVKLKQEHVKTSNLLKQRIDYLSKYDGSQNTDVSQYLFIKITDFLLREGDISAAKKLMDSLGIQSLIDFEELSEMNEIVQTIRRKETARVLRWCSENKVYLKKTKNQLEFKVRLQQFRELAIQGRTADAVAYSRQHLTKYLDVHLPRLTMVTTELISKPEDDSSSWDQLVSEFRQAFLEIHGKEPYTPLVDLIAAGLSALRTRKCTPTEPGIAGRHANRYLRDHMCPACSVDLGELAQLVPFAHHVKSVLDPDPVRLPNNNIYGLDVLHDYSAQVGVMSPEVCDPVTLEIFNEAELKKVYPS